MLAATLKYLEPANALPLWSVTIDTDNKPGLSSQTAAAVATGISQGGR